ncbi:hypothetical protein ABIA00_006594 [Bradyrhizobium ottawaense]
MQAQLFFLGTDTIEKRALATGVTGQEGAYSAELLLQKEYEVHGIKRQTSLFNTDRFEQLRRLCCYQTPSVAPGRLAQLSFAPRGSRHPIDRRAAPRTPGAEARAVLVLDNVSPVVM